MYFLSRSSLHTTIGVITLEKFNTEILSNVYSLANPNFPHEYHLLKILSDPGSNQGPFFGDNLQALSFITNFLKHLGKLFCNMPFKTVTLISSPHD